MRRWRNAGKVLPRNQNLRETKRGRNVRGRFGLLVLLQEEIETRVMSSAPIFPASFSRTWQARSSWNISHLRMCTRQPRQIMVCRGCFMVRSDLMARTPQSARIHTCPCCPLVPRERTCHRCTGYHRCKSGHQHLACTAGNLEAICSRTHRSRSCMRYGCRGRRRHSSLLGTPANYPAMRPAGGRSLSEPRHRRSSSYLSRTRTRTP